MQKLAGGGTKSDRTLTGCVALVVAVTAAVIDRVPKATCRARAFFLGSATAADGATSGTPRTALGAQRHVAERHCGTLRDTPQPTTSILQRKVSARAFNCSGRGAGAVGVGRAAAP